MEPDEVNDAPVATPMLPEAPPEAAPVDSPRFPLACAVSALLTCTAPLAELLPLPLPLATVTAPPAPAEALPPFRKKAPPAAP